MAIAYDTSPQDKPTLNQQEKQVKVTKLLQSKINQIREAVQDIQKAQREFIESVNTGDPLKIKEARTALVKAEKKALKTPENFGTQINYFCNKNHVSNEEVKTLLQNIPEQIKNLFEKEIHLAQNLGNQNDILIATYEGRNRALRAYQQINFNKTLKSLKQNKHHINAELSQKYLNVYDQIGRIAMHSTLNAVLKTPFEDLKEHDLTDPSLDSSENIEFCVLRDRFEAELSALRPELSQAYTTIIEEHLYQKDKLQPTTLTLLDDLENGTAVLEDCKAHYQKIIEEKARFTEELDTFLVQNKPQTKKNTFSKALFKQLSQEIQEQYLNTNNDDLLTQRFEAALIDFGIDINNFHPTEQVADTQKKTSKAKKEPTSDVISHNEVYIAANIKIGLPIELGGEKISKKEVPEKDRLAFYDKWAYKIEESELDTKKQVAHLEKLFNEKIERSSEIIAATESLIAQNTYKIDEKDLENAQNFEEKLETGNYTTEELINYLKILLDAQKLLKVKLSLYTETNQTLEVGIHPEELSQKAYCFQGKKLEFMDNAVQSKAFDGYTKDQSHQFDLDSGDLLIELKHGEYTEKIIPNNVKADPGAFIMLDSCNTSFENAVQVGLNSLKKGNTESAKILFFPDRIAASKEQIKEYTTNSNTDNKTGIEQEYDTPLHFVEIKNGQVYSGVFDSQKETTPLIYTAEQSRLVSFGKRTEAQHMQAIQKQLSEADRIEIQELNLNDPVDYSVKVEPLRNYLSKEQCNKLDTIRRDQLTQAIRNRTLSRPSAARTSVATTTQQQLAVAKGGLSNSTIMRTTAASRDSKRPPPPPYHRVTTTNQQRTPKPSRSAPPPYGTRR